MQGKQQQKRDSLSSSDDPLDTSDELEKLPMEMISIVNDNVSQYVRANLPQPKFVSCQENRDRGVTGPTHQEVPQFTHAEEMIRDAEWARARIIDVPGKDQLNIGQDSSKLNNLEVTYHSSLLDKGYLLVGNYVDECTRQKVGNGEYVDFAKLMPRDRVADDDNRMEMVNRNGLSYWVPVADFELTAISNFSKWEQAFRVFSNIYTSYHPARAGELIQYNHIIHTASQTYIWDNVYRYDREFRIHMSKHHLNRSWAVILQQAWTMFLKDRLNYTPNNSKHSNTQQGNGSNSSNSARRKICFDFNRVSCSFGKRCKFEHRCSFCNKFGHGLLSCHKAQARGMTGGSSAPVNQFASNNLDNSDHWNKYEQQHAKNTNNNNDKSLKK